MMTADPVASDDFPVSLPYAVAVDGELAWAHSAPRDREYRCPSCDGELILRRGEIRRPHFAHRSVPERCEFQYETPEHYRAKHKVANLIGNGSEVTIKRPCSECGFSMHHDLNRKSVERATVEHELKSGYVADVGLLGAEGTLVAVVEVCENHPIPEEKIESYDDSEFEWMEFSAEQILNPDGAPNDELWSVRRDGMPNGVCGRCKRKRYESQVKPLRRKQRRRRIREGSTKLSFEDPFGLQVRCPVFEERVDIFSVCSKCDYLVDVNHEGILCLGDEVFDET